MSNNKAKKKTKEARGDWVAVESEFASSGGSKIEKARSAFQFYQKEKMSCIRDELLSAGGNVELGVVQKEVSTRVCIVSLCLSFILTSSN